MYTDSQVTNHAILENSWNVTMPRQNNEDILSAFWQCWSAEYRKTKSLDIFMYNILIRRVNLIVSFADILKQEKINTSTSLTSPYFNGTNDIFRSKGQLGTDFKQKKNIRKRLKRRKITCRGPNWCTVLIWRHRMEKLWKFWTFITNPKHPSKKKMW